MLVDMDIWFSDQDGNKIHVSKEPVTNVDDAIRLLKIGWTSLDEMRNSQSAPSNSHSSA